VREKEPGERHGVRDALRSRNFAGVRREIERHPMVSTGVAHLDALLAALGGAHMDGGAQAPKIGPNEQPAGNVIPLHSRFSGPVMSRTEKNGWRRP
jgi:hypothetical protein